MLRISLPPRPDQFLDAAAAAGGFSRPTPYCLQPRNLRVDLVLYIGGRDANSEDIGCEDAGIDTSLYGQIKARRVQQPYVALARGVIRLQRFRSGGYFQLCR